MLAIAQALGASPIELLSDVNEEFLGAGLDQSDICVTLNPKPLLSQDAQHVYRFLDILWRQSSDKAVQCCSLEVPPLLLGQHLHRFQGFL